MNRPVPSGLAMPVEMYKRLLGVSGDEDICEDWHLLFTGVKNAMHPEFRDT